MVLAFSNLNEVLGRRNLTVPELYCRMQTLGFEIDRRPLNRWYLLGNSSAVSWRLGSTTTRLPWTHFGSMTFSHEP
jgi:hypothetical protein